MSSYVAPAAPLANRRSLRMSRRSLWDRLVAVVSALSLLAATLVAGMVVAPIASADPFSVASAVSQPERVLAGEPITYDVSFRNESPTPWYNFAATLSVPNGVTFASSDALGEPEVYLSGTSLPGASPATQVPAGFQLWVWEDIADLPANAAFSGEVTAVPEHPTGTGVVSDPALFPVGAVVTVGLTAFASTDPRLLPVFPGSTGVGGASATAATTAQPPVATVATPIAAIRVTKAEPNEESELPRGVNTSSTEYTIGVENTTEGDTRDVVVVDYLHAGLEFLGGGAVDNSTAPEYLGAAGLAGTPAVSGYLAPVSVTTVEKTAASIGFPSDLANGVYTRVEWSLPTINAGAAKTIAYRVGIPLLENTMTWDGPEQTAASLKQGSNLDNNSGASTRHSAGTAEYTDATSFRNRADAAGTYQGAVRSDANRTATDWDDETVDGTDLRVLKSASTSSFKTGGTVTYTLALRGSEYTGASDIRLFDVIDDGVCPILPTGVAVRAGSFEIPTLAGGTESFTGSALPTECEPGSDVTAGVVSGASVDWVAFDPTRHKFVIAFSVDDMAAQENRDVTYPARMRPVYEAGNDTSATDRLLNRVMLNATTTSIGALGTAVPETIADDSSTTLGSEPSTISKKILPRGLVGDASAPCPDAGYVDGPVGDFVLGDVVCYELTVDFSGDVDSRNPRVIDIPPLGVDDIQWSWTLDTTSSTPSVHVEKIADPDTGATDRLEITPRTHGATLDGSGHSTGDFFVARGSVLTVHVWGTVNGMSAEPLLLDKWNNLMKFTQTNVHGDVTFDRAEAAFEPQAGLQLVKGVQRVGSGWADGTGCTGDSPDCDHVLVEETSTITYRVDLGSTQPASDGTMEGVRYDIDDLTVWDAVPSAFKNAVITGISDGGQVVRHDASSRPSGAPADTTLIVWDDLGIAKDATKTLTYTLEVPRPTIVATTHVNTASIIAYSVRTNTGSTEPLIPAGSLNTDSAADENIPGDGTRDASDVYLSPTVVAKSVVGTEVNDSHNNGSGTAYSGDVATTPWPQFVAGEYITYQYSVTVPPNTSIPAGAVLKDAGLLGTSAALGSAKAYTVKPGSEQATLPAGQSMADYSLSPQGTLTFAKGYTNATTEPQTFAVNLTVRTDGKNPNRTHNASLYNRASFSYSNGTGTVTQNATARAQFAVPAPSVVKTVNPSTTVTATEVLTYTITAGNAANRPTAYDSVVTDCVPVGLNVITPLPAGWSTSADACVDGGTELIWSPGDLVAGATKASSYQVTVDPNAAGGQSYTNAVSLVSNVLPDPAAVDFDTRNSVITVSDDITVEVPPAVITKTVTPGQAPIGDTVAYTARATLLANVNYFDAALIDTFPAGVTVDPSTAVFDCVDADTATSCAVTPVVSELASNGQTIGWALGDISSTTTDRVITLTYQAALTDGISSATPTNSIQLAWDLANDTDPTTVTDDFDAESTPGTAAVTILNPNVLIAKHVNGKDTVTVNPGDEFDYTLTATNVGNTPAHNLLVTDTVPAGVIVDPDSISNGGTLSGADPVTGVRTITWDASDLAGPLYQQASAQTPTSITLSYSATLAASADIDDDTITNTTRVERYESFAEDGRAYGPSPEADAAVDPAFPKLALTKTAAGTDVAYAGTPFGWTLTATNTGDGPAKTVTLTDTLPANWIYTSVDSVTVAGSPWAGTTTPTISGAGTTADPEKLVWSFTGSAPVLQPGESIVISFLATPGKAALATAGVTRADGTRVPHINSLAATATDTTDAAANATRAYGGPNAAANAYLHSADLVVEKTAAGPMVAGSPATTGWTITVTNEGPDPSVGPFLVEDTSGALPDGVEITGASGTGWDCLVPVRATDGSTAFSCERTNPSDGLASGSAFQPIRVRAQVAADFDPSDLPGGLVGNTALVSTSGTFDPNSDNDDDSAGLEIDTAGDLTIEKAVATPEADRNAGSPLSWTITPTNNGPSVSYSTAGSPITVEDVLPAGVAGVVASGGTTWSCNAPASAPLDGGDTLTCSYTGAAMPVGDATAITVTAKLLSAFQGNLENTAEIAPGATVDGDPTNNDTEVTIIPGTDTALRITKTRVVADGNDWVPATHEIIAGEQLSYLVTVVADGPADARNVTVTDELPASLKYVSHASVSGTWARTSGPTTGDQEFSLTGTLVAGTSGSFVVTALIDSSTVGDVVNWAQAEADNSTNTPRDDDNSGSDRQANLSIVKSHTGDAVAGGSLGYTITITNEGPSYSSGPIVVTDVLPNGFSYVAKSATVAVAAAAFAAEPTVTGQSLTWTVGDASFSLQDGQTIVITLGADLAADLAAQDLVNTATVDGPDDTDPSDDAWDDPTTVVTQADLRVVKAVEAGPYLAGTSVDFTLTVTNDGPSAGDATVTDVVPAGLTVQAISGSGWDCDLATATCEYDAHPVGAAAATTITVTALIDSTVPDGTALENIAELDWADSRGAHEADDAEEIAVSTMADLGLLKTAVDTAGAEITKAAAGEQARYLIEVTNHGPSLAAGPITVTDRFPVGVSYVGVADSTFWDCLPGAIDPVSGQLVTCELTSSVSGLASGAAAPALTMIARLDATLPTGSVINTATVESATNEPAPDPAPNTDDAPLEVARLVNLGVAKSHSGAVRIGDDLAFSLLVNNDGPSEASGVVVVDTLPDGLDYVGSTGSDSGWTVGAAPAATDGTTRVTATLSGTLLPGDVAPNLMIVAAVQSAAYPSAVNLAEVSGIEPETTLADNSSEDVVAVPAQVDLKIVKTVVSPVVAVGQIVNYRLTVNNNGPTEDPGPVIVTDTLPDSLRIVSVDNAQCDVVHPTAGNGGGIECEFSGPLTSGASVAVTVTADVLAGAFPAVTNTANVSTVSEDTDPGNDESSVTSQVIPDIRFDLDKTLGQVDGTTVFWTITATSVGLNDAFGGVALRDELPAALNFVGFDSADGVTCVSTGQSVDCAYPNPIAAGEDISVTLETTTTQGPGETVTNSAWTLDPVTGDVIDVTLATAEYNTPLAFTGGGNPIWLLVFAGFGLLGGAALVAASRLRRAGKPATE